MKKLRATYQRVEKDYTFFIDYSYEWEDAEWDYPGMHELQVTEAYIDSEIIPLEFYYDFLHDQLEEAICEHAKDNI